MFLSQPVLKSMNKYSNLISSFKCFSPFVKFSSRQRVASSLMRFSLLNSFKIESTSFSVFFLELDNSEIFCCLQEALLDISYYCLLEWRMRSILKPWTQSISTFWLKSAKILRNEERFCCWRSHSWMFNVHICFVVVLKHVSGFPGKIVKLPISCVHRRFFLYLQYVKKIVFYSDNK